MTPDQPERLDPPTCGCPLCAAGQPLSLAPVSAGPAAAPSYVAALLTATEVHWGSGAVGTGASVTYSFLETAPSYANATDASGFAPLSEAQRTAVRQAFAAWSEVANIFFVETTDTANGGTGGSIRLGSNRQTSSSGYAYYPTGSLYDTGGDIYLANNIAANASPTRGSAGFLTLLHEIGHAIGLKHPGNYNAAGGSTTAPPYLPTAEDNYRYTVMSYFAHPSLGTNGLSSVPALYDVAAAQYLYGANTATRTGNDIYTFSSTTAAFSTTIWDGGGTDTIDAGQQTAALSIDLAAGGFSSIGRNGASGSGAGPAVGNVAIAYGVTIENAVGGAGSDILLGNAAANTLTGGAGNDTLTGGGGDDAIHGGDGLDTAVFSGNRAAYSLTIAGTTVTVTHLSSGSDGTDTLTNVEYLQFADQRLGLRPPTVAVTRGTLSLGTSARVDALLSITDPDGVALSQYEFIDTSTGGGYLSLGGTEQAVGATVAVTAATLSALTFTAAGQPAADRISVRAYNGLQWSDWATVTLSSRAPNRPPVVQADKLVTVQEGAGATPLGIAQPRDPEDDVISVTLTALPSSGTVRLANGTAVTARTTLSPADLRGLTYTPAAGFAGAAGSFAYTVADALDSSSGQTVTFRVTALSQVMAGFNPYVYLASNLDLADVFGLNGPAAQQHYTQSGRFEGRRTDRFDPYAYLGSNPDLATAFGLDPTAAARHYLANGRHEGRPTTGFDPLGYLAANADLAAAFGPDPARAVEHYLGSGQREGRSASFDAYAYLASNPDLVTGLGVDPAAAARHYITNGRHEGRSVSFDPLAYLAANPDLAAAFGVDTAKAAEHYMLYGQREGRGASFDAYAYLAVNPDLAAAFDGDRSRAEEHYIRYGRTEGRATSGFNAGTYLAADPELRNAFGTDETLALTYRVRYEQRPRRDATFDSLSYLAANPDLAEAFGLNLAAARAHYESRGNVEGRSTRFNAFAYLVANPDLQAAFGGDDAKALEHFIRYGRHEMRPDPLGYTGSAASLAPGGPTFA